MTVRYRKRFRRRVYALALGVVTVWVVYAAASAHSVQALSDLLNEHAETVVALIRMQLPDAAGESGMPAATAFILAQSPLLYHGRTSSTEDEEPAVPPAEEKEPVPSGGDGDEEEIAREEIPVIADNGVNARTLVPVSAQGYTVTGAVYVDNRSVRDVDTAMFLGGHSLAFAETDAPQVLIVHTHGSEAYTMPPGEEYVPSGDCRTTDINYSVVRVGEELAAVLEAAGIAVLHDKTLYDHPRYSGAYERSLSAVERYLKEYPSIVLVLDLHRDAISDADGNICKIVSDVGGVNAAQLCFVVGTDGGGASHPNWRENLKLAAEIQQTLCADYPTLMRPITVRNSRYNQHTSAGSLLVEVGAAGNSLQEPPYSVRLLGEAIIETVGTLRAAEGEIAGVTP